MKKELKIPSLEGKRVLVTGGCGFLGSNLARRLVKDNSKVTLFVRPGKDKENIKDFENKVDIIEGDILNLKDVETTIKDKDYIFHLAWQTDLKKSMLQPIEDLKTDCIGLLNILESCKIHNKNVKIIFASTTTVIGVTDKIPASENQGTNPLSIYEANKLLGEKYLYIYSKIHGLKTTVLRLSNVFGEGQKIDNPSRGVLNFMIGKTLRNEPLTVYGTGNFIRDYCYVQNYVDAFILAAATENTNGEAYVLGSGNGLTFNEMVEKIKRITEELTGKKIEITHIPWPDEDNPINKRNFIADYGKFNRATGWYPRISFEEGLMRTIEYYYKKIK